MNYYKPCDEFNEISWRISGEFGKKVYQALLRNQNECEPIPEISASQAITEFLDEVRKYAKENGFECTFYHNGIFYILLIIHLVFIVIERNTGNFSISAPHIGTKQFTRSEYKRGVKWIRDYLAVDVKPLTKRIELVREKIYLNQKSAQIVKTSINSLCISILGKKKLQYKLNQNWLTSEIIFMAADNNAYQIELYHKPFTKNTSFLIELLNKPRELKIEDEISCCRSEEDLLNTEAEI